MDGMVNRSKIEQDVILHVENKKKKKIRYNILSSEALFSR